MTFLSRFEARKPSYQPVRVVTLHEARLPDGGLLACRWTYDGCCWRQGRPVPADASMVAVFDASLPLVEVPADFALRAWVLA